MNPSSRPCGSKERSSGCRGLCCLAILFLLLGTSTARPQILDVDSNGVSDVWELLFSADNLDPAADTDGDGIPNRLESIAGTNPLDTNSVPRLSPLSLSETNASISIGSVPGKKYQLESSELLCGTTQSSNWIAGSSLIVRTGVVATLTAPRDKSTAFFRMVISDVDTDGDGLNDWEEYLLELDPLSSTSNGLLDGEGQPMNDHAYAMARIASQNVVTIAATDPIATQPDPGQPADGVGTFLVSRGGFPLQPVTVNLGLGGPGAGFATEGVDHEFLTRPIHFPAGVSSQTITLMPMANTNLAAPVVAMMKELSGSGYTVGIASNASVVIYPSPTPMGTGLTGQYFTNASTVYSSSANFNPANLFLTRVDPVIDFIWSTNHTPNLINGYYTVRWTGQVQPQYSETYVFDTRTDDGVKLWVNDQLLIDKWRLQSATTWTNSIDLQAGVRYNIRLEYFNRGGSARAQLSWYSLSQPKQIIPASRLYPATTPPPPAAVTSPMSAVAFLGQPFSYLIAAANSPIAYAAEGLPPGLGFNPTNGVIGGIPSLAGLFQVTLTASNAAGPGASVLDLQVIDTGSAVTREVWTSVPGTAISDIPLDTPADSAEAFGALEGIADYGDNYGERIRGYLTAPATGNYYFWIAGSDAAELWISNDSEPINKVRRAWTSGATASRQWTLHPTQKSAWLALVAGQRYYIEVLHKAGAGANDNWSVGWLQDPTGTNTVPAGVVPGYVLSRHFDLPPSLIPGTLYAANMLAQAGAVSSGVGSATLRVSADQTQAILKFDYSGLSSPLTGQHIHNDPYLAHPSQIMFDIDDGIPQPDGSYVWDIIPAGTLSAAEMVEIIKQGKAYINLHTANYPAGEINGHFTLAEGSQIFTPPLPPPAWTDDHSDPNAAARFLVQATFGPSPAAVAEVQALGYEGWIDHQFTLPPTHHLPNVLANVSADPTRLYPGNLTFNTWWRHSVTAPDQLRQRMAFALSEIVVVSENGVLQDNARALSAYYDMLLNHAFGDFRTLIEDVTLSPAMGLYLDMRRNDKSDLALGRHPNENYAREILQLFSVGLYRMWPDGTLVMNSQGNLVPTYGQDEILGFSRVFTGWNYYQTNQANGRLPVNWSPAANYTNAMTLVPTHHEPGTKRVLDNVILPAASGTQTDPAHADFDSYGLQDLAAAHDSILQNENVGPFLCRQLIQRLVTSNPSRDYLYRVVQKFNDNGSGVRGDMKAVIKAILLDYEARSGAVAALPTFGKQREPVLRVTAVARAFPSPPPVNGTYAQNGSPLITITTASAHRLNNNDDPFLTFTDTSGQPTPNAQGYNATITGLTTFTVPAPGIAAGTYGQSGTTIAVTNTGHGLQPGNSVHLTFTSGGAPSGAYIVASVPATSWFTVTAPAPATRSGNCLFPKWTGGGFVQRSTNITFNINGSHGLIPGDHVWVNFPAGSPSPNADYLIVTVPDPTRFTVISAVSATRTDNNPVVYPLAPPPLVRSGTVEAAFSTWNVNTTDTGNSSSLSQTPLNSPTVFNFFFPDYRFPGILAAAGLTTPEFQLTSDTSVMLQMNYLRGGILAGGNTNGLSSFNSSDGDIVLDTSPWMTPAYTSNAGIPNLIDALNSLLCAGQLSPAAKTHIVDYVANTANFGYSNPPTQTQMRNRVRAVVHLIITSPDFTIQK